MGRVVGHRSRIDPLIKGFRGRHRTIYRRSRMLPILGGGVRLGRDLGRFWLVSSILDEDLDLGPDVSLIDDEDVPFG